MTAIQSFLAQEDGAFIIDWAIVTASVIGLSLSVSSVVKDGTEEIINDLHKTLAGIETTIVLTRSGS